MVGGRSERGSRRRTHAASVVVPFPRAGAGDRLELARIVPSGRSLLLAFGLVVGILVAYWGAAASSLFAVRSVEVQGASGAVAREVRAVTRDTLGLSLLAVDAEAIEGQVRALPSVAGASVDRAFPHTLVVKVAPERAVAVARHRRSSWLVTGSGKVVREIETGSERGLPRIWVPRDVRIRLGGTLPSGFTPATRALAAVHEVGLRRRVKAVRTTGGELTLVLRRGPELRLGDPSDVVLKLAVAARVFPLLASDTAYLDLTVPERPVASRYLNP